MHPTVQLLQWACRTRGISGPRQASSHLRCSFEKYTNPRLSGVILLAYYLPTAGEQNTLRETNFFSSTRCWLMPISIWWTSVRLSFPFHFEFTFASPVLSTNRHDIHAWLCIYCCASYTERILQWRTQPSEGKFANGPRHGASSRRKICTSLSACCWQQPKTSWGSVCCWRGARKKWKRLLEKVVVVCSFFLLYTAKNPKIDADIAENKPIQFCRSNDSVNTYTTKPMLFLSNGTSCCLHSSNSVVPGSNP